MFSKKDRAWAKYRKEAKRPQVDARTRGLYTDQPTRRQFAKHITPLDNNLARSLGLTWDDLGTLSAGGAVRRVCPAHLEDLPRESLTVALGGGVLLLSCDRNCSSQDIVSALRAGPQ